MKDVLVQLIVENLRQLDAEQLRIPENVSADTTLFGREGILDSMALVTLVVAIEQAIEDRFGATVSLADERAMSQHQSPYRTVATLAAYAERLIAEGK